MLFRSDSSLVGQGRSGLSGPQQIAAVQFKGLIPFTLTQVPGEPVRLGQAEFIEGHIDLALEAQLPIPIGFAVSYQQKFGHWAAGLWAMSRRSTLGETKRSTSPPSKVISRTRVLETHW